MFLWETRLQNLSSPHHVPVLWLAMCPPCTLKACLSCCCSRQTDALHCTGGRGLGAPSLIGTAASNRAKNKSYLLNDSGVIYAISDCLSFFT